MPSVAYPTYLVTMPNYWILKTEPTTYSFDDLRRERRTVWDGVKNNLALRHIRTMQQGDHALVYHSGKEKALVGLAEIVKAPYPDPEQDDPKLVVMDIEAKGSLRRRVTLAEIKSDGSFEDLALVRLPRLSVVPVPAPQWNKLLRLGGKS
jgi:predicted RNA-binding protein with PUA-like domain